MSSSILKASDFCGLGRGLRLHDPVVGTPSPSPTGRPAHTPFRFSLSGEAAVSAAKPLFLIRIDFGPQPDQLDSHCNDLVCKQPRWICAETVTAAKALNGAFNFRQGTGDRRWNSIRV